MDLRLIFWEATRACNLECPHCRAQAQKERSSEELTTQEAKRFIESAASFSKPILVFSGGEALLREDIYELIRYADQLGLKSTVATNASLISLDTAMRLEENNTQLVAVSIYGSNAKKHDTFCGRQGAFEKTLAGIKNLKEAGLNLQIHTTITKNNLSDLEAIGNFAIEQGAIAYHVFFLVPVGRGKSIAGDEISAQEYEEAFNRLYDFQSRAPIRVKATCAPHYYRVGRQRGPAQVAPFPARPEMAGPAGQRPDFSSFSAVTKGCLAGQGVCFVSYKGEVFGCGYLPITAGDIRKQDFKGIWFESGLFKDLRDNSKLKGRCGICEFKLICSGCRARAYAQTGDFLEEEPYCVYPFPLDK